MTTSRVPSKTVLIGEAPSRRSDPARPFSGTSGEKLRTLTNIDRFDLRNLFDAYPGAAGKTRGTVWDAAGARVRASALAGELDGRRVVFVGRRVATAFDWGKLDWVTWAVDPRGFDVAVIPHPSGIVRFWNDLANVEAVARFLSSL